MLKEHRYIPSMTREMTQFCKIMTDIVIAGSFALLNVWNYLSMHFYSGEYLARPYRDKEQMLYFFIQFRKLVVKIPLKV